MFCIISQIFFLPCSLQIATANNLLTFGDYMKQLRSRYLKNEFDREEDDETNIRKDRFQVLNDTFTRIAMLVVQLILDEVLIDLRNHEHCMNELMTKNWYVSRNCHFIRNKSTQLKQHFISLITWHKEIQVGISINELTNNDNNIGDPMSSNRK
mgnify:CR=1 FL=1